MVARTHQGLFNSSFSKIGLGDGLKLPAKQQSKALTKKVRFSQQHAVFEIPHINDLTDEEIEAVWMKDEDFKAIRKECRRTIMALEKGCIEVLIGVELRGLEHHMPSQQRQKDAVRELLYTSVEKLQCFQDETGIDVSDILAETCQKISSRAEMMALQMALGDEVEVKT